jgi:hypothetical protein
MFDLRLIRVCYMQQAVSVRLLQLVPHVHSFMCMVISCILMGFSGKLYPLAVLFVPTGCWLPQAFHRMAFRAYELAGVKGLLWPRAILLSNGIACTVAVWPAAGWLCVSACVNPLAG